MVKRRKNIVIFYVNVCDVNKKQQHEMLLPLQILLFNQTILWRGLREIKVYLPGPTLIYHDSHSDMDYVNIVVQSLSSSQAVLVAQVPQQPSSDYPQIPRSFIFIATNIQYLVNNLRTWRLWNARARVLVILQDTSTTHEWLDTLWKRTRAVDVMIMILKDDPEYFTWFPYQKNECSNVLTIRKINSSALYPTKFGPFFHNCPLIAVTSVLPPLVINETAGIEPKLFHDLAQKLGMTPSYAHLPDDTYVWTIFDKNHEPVTGLKLLWENNVDIIFSNMKVRQPSAFFADFLPIHTVDNAVFFVPGPKYASRATAIYRAFAPLAWAYVSSVWVAIYLTLTVISYANNIKNHSTFLHTLAINLSQPAHLPSSTTYVFFAVLAYFYSLHITTGYQSSLIIFLSDAPRQKPIQTLEDLVDSKLPIELHEAARDDILALSKTTKYSVFREPGRTFYTNFLHLPQVADPGTNAMLAPKLAFSFQLGENKTYYDEFEYPKILILGELVIKGDICFYISKGHPLYSLLNRYTMYLIEAGIPGHYSAELTKPPHPKLRHLESFGLKNVEGPFLLFLELLAMATSVFLIELMVSISKRTQTRHLYPPNARFILTCRYPSLVKVDEYWAEFRNVLTKR